MAFVSEFFPLSAVDSKSRMHSSCRCGWRTADREGSVVLQLDTYGSDQRQDHGTVSQSIQIDRERAQELLDILRSTFHGLD